MWCYTVAATVRRPHVTTEQLRPLTRDNIAITSVRASSANCHAQPVGSAFLVHDPAAHNVKYSILSGACMATRSRMT